MDIETLSEKPFQALEALATYRYLTAKQLVDLGIAASPTVARDHVFAKLERGRKPFAKAHNSGRHIGFGQLPYIHYMTNYGAEALAEYRRVPVNEILYPKGGVQFQRDFHHRLGVIDIHIKFRQWAESKGIELTIADLYFDKIGNQKFGGQVSRTRVDLSDGSWIEPDAIFGFQYKGQDYLYAVEYHRFPDVGRIMEQLGKHVVAFEEGAISRSYGVRVANFVLSVHQSSFDKVKNKVKLNRLFENYSRVFKFFELSDFDLSVS